MAKQDTENNDCTAEVKRDRQGLDSPICGEQFQEVAHGL